MKALKCQKAVRYIDQDIPIAKNQRHFEREGLLLEPEVETPEARGFALPISS